MTNVPQRWMTGINQSSSVTGAPVRFTVNGQPSSMAQALGMGPEDVAADELRRTGGLAPDLLEQLGLTRLRGHQQITKTQLAMTYDPEEYGRQMVEQLKREIRDMTADGEVFADWFGVVKTDLGLDVILVEVLAYAKLNDEAWRKAYFEAAGEMDTHPNGKS